MVNRRVLWLVASMLGCGSEGGPEEGSDDGGIDAAGGGECEVTSVVIDPSAGPLDLLFVIDNSNSMETEQQRLGAQLDVLMQALAGLPDGFPNAHIGVVSTDLGSGPYTTACDPVGGDQGRLQDGPRIAGCTPPGDAYIDITNANGVLSGNIANVDTPTANGLGCQGLVDLSNNPIPADGDTAIDVCDIQAAFRCIAALGTGGCGFEQPLEAARRALTCTEADCTNPGFQRADSLLAVVFLGDEDDCSARDGEIFDPSSSALGPPTSYRCFEFGVTCDEPIDRSGAQTLTGCRSKTVEDVADPDDLLLFPIQEYYDFFSTLRPDGDVVVAGITGPYAPGDEIGTALSAGLTPDLVPACTLNGETAFPGVRLNEFIRRFGNNGVVIEDQNAGLGICTDEFSPALAGLGDGVARGAVSGCFDVPLIHDSGDGPEVVTNPEDASCTVVEVVGAGTPDEVLFERERCRFNEALLECADTPPGLSVDSPVSCWYVCDGSAPEAGGCDYRWRLRFCRDSSCDPTTQAPPGTEAYVQCAACNPAACDCP